MSGARLASSVTVGALLRLAEREGGFAAVIAKGDATSGSIGLIIVERGERRQFLERALTLAGNYEWRSTGPAAANEEEFTKFLDRRRGFDPDQWILELDVPSAERFVAQLAALD